MKTLLLIVTLFSSGMTLSQKKLKTEDLRHFDWVLYNQYIADSCDVFQSDTLLLIKTYDNNAYEHLSDENGQDIDRNYTDCWNLTLNELSDDSTGNRMEFSVYHIDFRQAAMNKKLEVDSVPFYLLRENPTALSLDSASKIHPVLSMLENGDVVQVTNRSDQHFYYIKRSGNQLQLLTTLRQRFVYYPKGLNEGYWSFFKKKQTLTFYDITASIGYVYRVECIDDLRIRLVRTAIELR